MPEWPTPPVGRAVRFLPAAHQNGLKAALHGGGIRKLSALTGAGDWEMGLSQILCKHRNAVQIEQNLFKAEVAQAAAALFSK